MIMVCTHRCDSGYQGLRCDIEASGSPRSRSSNVIKVHSSQLPQLSPTPRDVKRSASRSPTTGYVKSSLSQLPQLSYSQSLQPSPTPIGAEESPSHIHQHPPTSGNVRFSLPHDQPSTSPSLQPSHTPIGVEGSPSPTPQHSATASEVKLSLSQLPQLSRYQKLQQSSTPIGVEVLPTPSQLSSTFRAHSTLTTVESNATKQSTSGIY